MKRIKWLMLVAAVAGPLFTGFAQTQASQPPAALSPAAAEVLKLAQSGTSDDVLLAYVQNSTTSFSLTADQILYLKDLGVSSPVVSSMLNRDQALRNQPQQYNYQQRLYAPATPAPAEPSVAQAPEPAAPAATEAAPPPPPAPAPVAAATPAPTYVSTPPPDVNYFYQDLSPYGTWVDLPDYGWCWQPTVVVINHGWRPYCDSGHWMWTDAGWYWVSDYSWGWAPFHYGRWYLHDRCGWVWCPDRVWGPAWVAWRHSDDYCGWAPLPPRAVFDVRLGWSFNGVRVGVGFDFGLHADHFCFIGLGDFCSHDLGHRCMPHTEVTRVYNRTTIINNNYIVNNNTIINQGVKVERVAAATHTEIHKAVIRDLPAGANPGARAGAEKGAPVIYRPQLHAPARPVNMVAQKVDARHPVIQHTELATPRAVVKSTPVQSRTTTTTTHDTRQPEASRVTTHSVPEKSAPAHTDYSAPKGHGAQTSAAAMPSESRKIEQPKAETRVAQTSEPAPQTSAANSHRSVEEAKPATRSLPNYNSAPQSTTYPLHTNPRAWTEPNASGSESQNSHTYYPKGYRQSADVHALPPVNAHDNSFSSSGNGNSSSKKHQN